MKNWKKIAVTISVAVLLASCAGAPAPSEVGLRDDGTVPVAAPPPSSPNCVSSYVDPGADEVHGAEPIPRGTRSAVEAQNAIRDILAGSARTDIISDVPGYIHSVQYTPVFYFPDDVEFWFPEDEAVVHFRSASRLGYGDLGVNRRRMESIRNLFVAQ